MNEMGPIYKQPPTVHSHTYESKNYVDMTDQKRTKQKKMSEKKTIQIYL